MSSFSLLQKALDTDISVNITDNMLPIYKRFFSSYQNNFKDRSLLDVAILFRQILLQENNNAVLFIPNNSKYPPLKEWNKVGIIAKNVKSHWEIYANFWRAKWLKESKKQAVDYCVSLGLDRRENINFSSNASDIFLTQCGTQYINYKSIDQQKAVRTVLSLDRGKTLAISLPTGEGKSLIFKLINSVGFYDTKNRGLTIVIVPTVTLALDQEKSMQMKQKSQSVYAFVGEREKENEILKDKIKQGEQDICFVSPEFVFGSLRQALISSAKNGNIRAVVIDEAHIVEEWGVDFRHEFQLFSGFWRELLDSTPITNRFRTVLLSATYTQESINLLKTLFSLDNRFEFYSATKLRPEIDYWMSPILKDEEEQKIKVLEAIYRLPRPLILYVTEVKDAKLFYTLLRDSGFKNLAMVHGQTKSIERNRVVDLWRAGELDMMVATSAFGLGIDYPHTRSIIHACMPETLNRFYQEVGRGGRDGKSSISLIIPTHKDIKIAESINNKKIIGDELGFKRWKSMFNRKENYKDKSYTINLNTAPSYGIDFDSKKNIGWNTQVLLLMTRAGLIELIGFPEISQNEEELDRHYHKLNIKIIEENHLDEKVWSSAIGTIRNRIQKSNKDSLNLLKKFIKQEACPADILNQIYELSLDDKKYEVSLLCSSCKLCRGESPKYSHAPLGRVYPIQRVSHHRVLELFSTSSIMVEFTKESFKIRGFDRKFIKVIHNLVAKQIQNFIFIGNAKELFLSKKILEKIRHLPIFIEELEHLQQLIIKRKRLPPQTSVLFIGDEIKIDKKIVNILKEENNMVFLKKDTIDPITPNRLLNEVYQYELMQLDEFIARIGR
jgi:superfamily II DNA/RNA helicase